MVEKNPAKMGLEVNELSFILLALSAIVLTWVVVRVNEKVDNTRKRLKKFEDLFKRIKRGEKP